MGKPARRDHYLSQFYLRRFAGPDGLVCVFDRETKEFRRQHPRVTAVENDFYTITDRQGRKSDSLERALSELENTARGVVERLDNRITGWRDEEELFAFTMFIAFLYTRTPIFDKEQTALGKQMFRLAAKADYPSPEVTAQWFRKFEEKTGDSVEGLSPEDFCKVIQNDEYEVNIPREYNIRLMMDATQHLADILLTMNWHFVRAPREMAFVTSDGPFVTAPPAGFQHDWRAYGVLTPGAVSMVPLSPSTCLIIDGKGNDFRYGHFNKDTVRRINANVAQNSDRFIIGRDEAYLRKIVKNTRADQYRWISRFEFKTDEIDGELLLHTKRGWPQKGRNDPPVVMN